MKTDDARTLLARGRAALHGERQLADATGTVPVAHYLDPDRLARERAALRAFPVPIASSSELARPGDWLAREAWGSPLLLTRGADGRLGAFLNVCRHRGVRLAPDGGAGSDRRSFSCPYHGWTYAAGDGRLQGVPQDFGFPCLDREAHGLVPVPAIERAGLVWCVPDPATGPLGPDALGPLADELEGFGLGRHVRFAPRRIVVRANWKLLVDGSLEAYHFKVAHRQTIAAMFENNVQLVDEFGLHRRLFLVKSRLAEATGEELHTADAQALRQYGNTLYSFFPSTAVLLQPDHAQLSWTEPLDAATTAVHDVALLPEAPATEKAEAYWRKNVELYRRTLQEDYDLAESTQAGLASGANTHLRFGTFEFAAPRFHAQLAALLER